MSDFDLPEMPDVPEIIEAPDLGAADIVEVADTDLEIEPAADIVEVPDDPLDPPALPDDQPAAPDVNPYDTTIHPNPYGPEYLPSPEGEPIPMRNPDGGRGLEPPADWTPGGPERGG